MPDLRSYRTEPLLEVASSVDADDNRLWMPLGPSYSHDILAPQRPRIIATVTKLFYSSPLCRRIVQSYVDFIVGEGFQLVADDEDANALLREFWESPVHRFGTDLPLHVQELVLFGELCYLVETSAGRTAVTFIPSSYIADVVPDPGIPGKPVELVLSDGSTYPIISYNDDRWDGKAFYFSTNRTADQVRGYPWLLAAADWLSLWETYLYNRVEKQAHASAIWWDVTLEGFTQEQIDQWLKSARAAPPRPGSVIAHNEKVTWDLKSTAGAEGSPDFPSFISRFILASSGLVPWEAKNARESGEILDPVIRSLSTRQAEIRSFYEMMGQFVVQVAVEDGLLPKGNYRVRCIAPRLGVRDVQRSSGALERITTSLTTAVQSGWLSQEEAGRVYRDLLSQLGLLPER